MAILDSVDDLKEHSFDELVIANILRGKGGGGGHEFSIPYTVSANPMLQHPTHPLPLCDHSEQISVLTVVHDNVDRVAFLYYPTHGNDMWMLTSQLMKSQFPSLKLSLS